jgi:hypothetical protein
MSINGINQATYSPAALTRVAPERAQAQPAPASNTPKSQQAAESAEALSAAAPEGVDPALWNVLTTEERAYFSRIRSLGPLTYGPSSTPARPALRGGRIDVTV